MNEFNNLKTYKFIKTSCFFSTYVSASALKSYHLYFFNVKCYFTYTNQPKK